jgi:hypothetical protein
MLPWEIRASDFTYPPPPSEELDVVTEVFGLKPREDIPQRHYREILAVPLDHQDIPDPGRVLAPAVEVLFEVVNGVLTMPRAKKMREQRVLWPRMIQLSQFRMNRLATDDEMEFFKNVVDAAFPDGIPVKTSW